MSATAFHSTADGSAAEVPSVPFEAEVVWDTKTIASIDEKVMRRLRCIVKHPGYYLRPVSSSHQSAMSTVVSGRRKRMRRREYIPFEGPVDPAKKTDTTVHFDDSTVTKEERDVWRKILKDVLKEQMSSRIGVPQQPDSPSNSVASYLDLGDDEELGDRQWPESLRAAFRGVVEAEKAEKTSTVEESDSDDGMDPEVEQVRYAMIQEIADERLSPIVDMLNNAKTELDVWNIITKQIFGCLNKLVCAPLQSSEDSAEPEPDVLPTIFAAVTAAKDAMKKNYGQDVPVTPEMPNIAVPLSMTAPSATSESPSHSALSQLTLNDPDAIRASIHEIEIVEPVFADSILYTMRLLAKSFPYSSLRICFLPAIRSHSRLAYILGATTDFYNEVMAAWWFNQMQLHDIITLLHDMAVNEVGFNADTLTFLDGIVNTGKEDLTDGKGESALTAWRRCESTREEMKLIAECAERLREVVKTEEKK